MILEEAEMESNVTLMAERVREACISAALRAHEDAGLQGLCSSGRWEAAVAAIRELDLRPLITAMEAG